MLEIVQNELESISQLKYPPVATESRADSPRNEEPIGMVSRTSAGQTGKFDTFIYPMPGAFDF